MELIRVGVIGMGMIGRVHLDALRRIPGVVVTALCDSSEEKLQTLQAAFGIKHVCTDWQELVNLPDVDAIHNCTPNHMHHQVNEAALRAGKMVFSEKPLGINPQETGEIARLAQETGLPAGVNFCYRYYPMVQWMKQLISQGEIGEVRAVHGHYLQDWLMFAEDFDWRVDSSIGGSLRALADIGSHWLDLAEYVTGLKVERVFGDVATIHPQRKNTSTGALVDVDTDDWATALLQFSGSVKGNFTVSQISGGHKNDFHIEVVGSKASLRWSQENPEFLLIGKRGGVNQLQYKEAELAPELFQEFSSFPSGHPEGYGDCVKNSIQNFYACAKDNRNDYPTFELGHRITQLTTAIAQSSKEETWVTCTF